MSKKLWQGAPSDGPGITGYEQEVYYHVYGARTRNPMRIYSLPHIKAALLEIKTGKCKLISFF